MKHTKALSKTIYHYEDGEFEELIRRYNKNQSEFYKSKTMNEQTKAHYDFFYDSLPESMTDLDRRITANNMTVYLLEKLMEYNEKQSDKTMELINDVFSKNETV